MLLARAIAAIDGANNQDPTVVEHDGIVIARETLYGQRMSATLDRFEPNASDELRVAVRAQHLCRWKIARADYPDGRAGYKRWRSDLARLHADLLAELLSDVACAEGFIARACSLVRKQRLSSDPEAQILEDVACLVFLEHYFGEFSAKHEPDKLVDIVRKTWGKMSERGHAAALALALPPAQAAIVARALA